MSKFVDCELDQAFLLPPDLRDWIPEDDLAHFVIAAVERGVFRWRDAVELHEVVGGTVPGRPTADAITLFESQGIGIEDVACYAYVLRKARDEGVGQELPF